MAVGSDMGAWWGTQCMLRVAPEPTTALIAKVYYPFGRDPRADYSRLHGYDYEEYAEIAAAMAEAKKNQTWGGTAKRQAKTAGVLSVTQRLLGGRRMPMR